MLPLRWSLVIQFEQKSILSKGSKWHGRTQQSTGPPNSNVLGSIVNTNAKLLSGRKNKFTQFWKIFSEEEI